MLVEILLGVGIGLVVILGAVVIAVKTPKIKGPSHHGTRGGGDYADGHVRTNRGFDVGGDDGGGD